MVAFKVRVQLMAGDPEKCRLNAMRCLRLAERARRPEVRERFTALAEIWKRLAAECESDQPLLAALSELNRSEPYDSLVLALNLRSGPHGTNELENFE
jgi:hypothetical protein